jgi:tellurite resistance protein
MKAMADKSRSVDRKAGRKLKTDEALIALFIGAMNANDQVEREELERAQHLIWSTRRFRQESGETVGRMIDRMKQVLEEEDAAEVMDRAAKAIPAGLRPSAFAVVADLLLTDGEIDAGERKFLRQLAKNFNMPARVATNIVDAMLTKNRL